MSKIIGKTDNKKKTKDNYVVNQIQKYYRKLNPAPSPFFYPEQRPDYLFSKIEKESIQVITEDDITLTITNKHPREKSKDLYPVICLPGLAETRFVLDQALGNSFVDYLALNGFDVYMAELRGHGKSRHLKERYNWNVQTFLDYDIPAIINKVIEVSGQKQVFWVGHSMGGMLMMAYLISAGLHKDKNIYDTSLIRGGITIGTPVVFNQPSLIGLALLYKTTPLIRFPFFPTDVLSNLLSIFGFVLDSPLTYHFWNWKNMEQNNKVLYLKDGLDNIAQGVMRDFMEYALVGDFMSSDGKINYRENLFLINTPMLMVAGIKDALAGPSSQQLIYDHISSNDKEVRLFGTRGYMIRDGVRIKMKDNTDYGHVDLTLGKHSKDEVWTYMLNWLRKRAKVGNGKQDTAAPKTSKKPAEKKTTAPSD